MSTKLITIITVQELSLSTSTARKEIEIRIYFRICKFDDANSDISKSLFSYILFIN